MCSTDKVIRSVKLLVKENEEEKKFRQKRFKELSSDLKKKTKEVEQIKGQLKDQEKTVNDYEKDINKQIA